MADVLGQSIRAGNMKYTDRLFELQDKEYAAFQAKLTPTVKADDIIGVRTPQVKKLAREFMASGDCSDFFNALPHAYYDENMLHGLMIAEIKDYDSCIFETEKFLPYVDNWAVCDSIIPKVYKKHKAQLIDKIYQWSSSSDVYTCRFGIKALMTFFLDDDFKAEYLEIPAKVHSDEYYINMMIAWYYATALAKQWDATVVYLTENKLDDWIHNKTIQKAVESLRITPQQKELLRGLKRK